MCIYIYYTIYITCLNRSIGKVAQVKNELPLLRRTFLGDPQKNAAQCNKINPRTRPFRLVPPDRFPSNSTHSPEDSRFNCVVRPFFLCAKDGSGPKPTDLSHLKSGYQKGRERERERERKKKKKGKHGPWNKIALH